MLKSKLMKSVMMGVVAAFMVTTVNAQAVKVNGVYADYTSKYVWRGFNLFGSQGAFQPSVDMSLAGDSGLGLNIWGSIPTGTDGAIGEGVNDWTEVDYTLSYGTSIGEGPTTLDVGFNWIYFQFPSQAQSSDTQEVGISLGLPELLPCGVAIGYYGGYLWGEEGGGTGAGGYHNFAISKDFAIDDTYSISAFADISYIDQQFDIESDWTHSTYGVSLGGIEFSGLSVSPFVNYQVSYVDAFDDTLYGGVSCGYEF